MPFQVYESHVVITSTEDVLFKIVRSRLTTLSQPLIFDKVSIKTPDES